MDIVNDVDADVVFDSLVRFLTGNFPYSGELQAFWMAIQGAMAVRSGPNKNKQLHWFHAFALSVLAGYAGATFGFLWMGKPSSMLANDFNMAACITAFVIVNYTPFDVGRKICGTLPVTIVTVSFAQLFRALGLVKFIGVCFDAFKENPSPYYPIPVFGPILYGTLLGNMGGIFMKGFEGHVANGMPWPFQNGIFCGSFYHFFVHDQTGPIGSYLRASFIPLAKTVPLLQSIADNEKLLATFCVSLFVQVMGILQIPAFLGPSFSPFGVDILSPWKDSTTWTVGKTEDSEYSKRKRKKRNRKKKGAGASADANGETNKEGEKEKQS